MGTSSGGGVGVAAWCSPLEGALWWWCCSFGGEGLWSVAGDGLLIRRRSAKRCPGTGTGGRLKFLWNTLSTTSDTTNDDYLKLDKSVYFHDNHDPSHTEDGYRLTFCPEMDDSLYQFNEVSRFL